MTPYQLDDLNTHLGLSLPENDEAVFESYEAVPLNKVVDGYRVENHKGLDVGVIGYPQEIDMDMNETTMMYTATFEDDNYEAIVTVSPTPIQWEDLYETDEDLEIGTARHMLSSDPYVQIKERHEPGDAISELIERRGDIAQGAQRVVGDYVRYDVDNKTTDGVLDAVRTHFQDDTDQVTVSHERAEQLADHFM
ncbi:MAG: hypothetical protein MUP66_03300 [Candidatus Nanohaloarchaeota archaeon QJJ-5]|nr:hypothetical protein [Candidatus Nanohaloarchaeota archaeon QJJ-5]